MTFVSPLDRCTLSRSRWSLQTKNSRSFSVMRRPEKDTFKLVTAVYLTQITRGLDPARGTVRDSNGKDTTRTRRLESTQISEERPGVRSSGMLAKQKRIS